MSMQSGGYEIEVSGSGDSGDSGGLSDAANLILLVGSVYYQRKQQKKAEEAARQARERAKERAATKDVKLSGSNLPIPIAYGYTYTSAINIFTDVSSSLNFPNNAASFQTLGNLSSGSGHANEILMTQSVISGGGIDSVVHAEINDEDWTDAEYSNFFKSYMSPDGGIATKGSGLPVDRELATFNDIAYATNFFKMNRDKPQFSGKPTIRYFIKGRQLRTFNTDGSLTTTRSFSNNSVAVVLDYLMDNPLGPKIATSQLDLAYFRKAYDIAEVDPRGGAVAVSGKIYEKSGILTRALRTHEFNGLISPSASHVSNLEAMLENIPGALLFRGLEGKIKIVIPSQTSEIYNLTVTDDVLTSDIEVSYPDTNDKLNEVSISYMNSAKDFEDDTFEYTSQIFKDEDHGLKLSSSFSPAGVSNIYQAEYMAKAIVNESRLKTFSFDIRLGEIDSFCELANGDIDRASNETSCNAFGGVWKVTSSLALEPGDVVHLASNRNKSKTDELVRLTDIRVKPDLSISCDAVEHTDTYSYASTLVEQVATRTSFDFSVTPPSVFAVTSIASEETLYSTDVISWTDAPDVAAYEYVITVERIVGSTDSVFVVPAGVEKFEHSPNQTGAYNYTIRARSKLGTTSLPVGPITSTVTVKTITDGISLDISDTYLSVALKSSGLVPLTDSVSVRLFKGASETPYDEGVTNPDDDGLGDLQANSWRLTSATSQPVSSGLAFASTISDTSVSFLFSYSEGLSQQDVPISLIYNPEDFALAVTDERLVTFDRFVRVDLVADGLLAINVNMTNNTFLIPDDDNYSGSGTDIHVFLGDTEMVYADPLVEGSFKVDRVIPSEIVQGSRDVSKTYASYGDISSLSGPLASIIHNITVRRPVSGVEEFFTLVQNFTKVNDGLSSNSIYSLFVYRRATTQPTTPTGGSYNFTTDTVSAPSDWFASPPSGTGTLYATSAVASIEGRNGTDSLLSWSTPEIFISSIEGVTSEEFVASDGLAFTRVTVTLENGSTSVYDSPHGQDGTTYNVLIVYADSATDPTTTSTSYTEGLDYIQYIEYEDTPPDHPTTGYVKWVGDDALPIVPIYASDASGSDASTVQGSNLFVNFHEGHWSDGESVADLLFVSISGIVGATGQSVFVGNIYKRSSIALETAPTGGSFDFTTNTLTAPSSWANSIPSGSENVYACQSTFSVEGTEGSVDAGVWTTPVMVSAQGSVGSRGAGWFRGVSASMPDDTDSEAVSSEFAALVSVPEVEHDRLILTKEMPSSEDVVKSWVYSGGVWVIQTAFIDGNLLVDGTVSASSLSVLTAGGMQVTIDDAGFRMEKTSSVTGGYLEITESSIKVFDGVNTLPRVQIGSL